jgi:hypothetical protein
MTADGTANELANGRANRHTNGHTNGHSNGAANGSSNGVAKTPGHHTSIQPSVEVAISPNDAGAVTSTIESIHSLGKTFSPDDNFGRQKLLAEARRLVRSLETPRETMIKHNWAQVSLALRREMAAADLRSLPHTWPSRLESILACSERCWSTIALQSRSLSWGKC